MNLIIAHLFFLAIFNTYKAELLAKVSLRGLIVATKAAINYSSLSNILNFPTPWQSKLAC
ncbi:hypothetical protein EV13_2152 [Prochlorococcus sp. MIT 0702]|nr:hypothetical protein EV12_1878 [Prochlorococcus sp. MIT 0701]KGG27340.1 hypothetical protein EV13_2152 [Prochlorococcus sp. MIT 0702]KGG36216.1 hypothetical protein EV14_0626 [Prochlorococcus sp. MIT 0703]